MSTFPAGNAGLTASNQNGRPEDIKIGAVILLTCMSVSVTSTCNELGQEEVELTM